MLEQLLWLCGEQTAQPGTLYVVATPLGNLGDVTFRAIRVLETCDVIACETPRVTQQLLAVLKISRKRLYTYRDAGEEASAVHLCSALKNGRSIALVSDAGVPTISDPGYRLVKRCREQSIPVVPIPGPNAAITALCVAGFPTHAFLFLGFLPISSNARKKALLPYQDFEGTLLLYESPHRMHKLLTTLQELFEPTRFLFIARELTKKRESFYRGTLLELATKTFPEKGEYVVCIAPRQFF